MDRTTAVKTTGYVLVACLVAGALFGCRSRDDKSRWKSSETMLTGPEGGLELAADSLWREVMCAQRLPQTFSAGYQLTFKMTPASGAGGQSVRLSGQVRMVEDSILWISAGMFGLEAFQAWVREDSLWVLNRMEGTVDVYVGAVWSERLAFILGNLPVLPSAMADSRKAANAVRAWLAALFSGRIPYPFQDWTATCPVDEAASVSVPALTAGGARWHLYPPQTVWERYAIGVAPKARMMGVVEIGAEGLKSITIRPVGASVNDAVAEAAAVSSETASEAFLRLSYPDANHWQLSGRQPDGAKFSLQVTYNKRKENEPVTIPMAIPEKYTIRYAD